MAYDFGDDCTHKKESDNTHKEYAKELVNKVYQPLGYLSCGVSNNVMWDYSIKIVIGQLDLILSEIPMYIGNINPKWEKWNNIKKEVEKLS